MSFALRPRLARQPTREVRPGQPLQTRACDAFLVGGCSASSDLNIRGALLIIARWINDVEANGIGAGIAGCRPVVTLDARHTSRIADAVAVGACEVRERATISDRDATVLGWLGHAHDNLPQGRAIRIEGIRPKDTNLVTGDDVVGRLCRCRARPEGRQTERGHRSRCEFSHVTLFPALFVLLI